MRIANVDLAVEGDFLKISAFAITPTLGWSEVSLAPVQYFVFPPDGVIDIELLGNSPPGNSADSVMVHSVSTTVPLNAALKGVRIRRENHTLITLFSTAKEAEDIGNDPIFLEGGSCTGDKLSLSIRYGGGCAPHAFQLSWDGRYLKSFPPQIALKLSHDKLEDTCKAIQHELLQFDLSTALGEHLPELMSVQVYSNYGQISVPVVKERE